METKSVGRHDREERDRSFYRFRATLHEKTRRSDVAFLLRSIHPNAALQVQKGDEEVVDRVRAIASVLMTRGSSVEWDAPPNANKDGPPPPRSAVIQVRIPLYAEARTGIDPVLFVEPHALDIDQSHPPRGGWMRVRFNESCYFTGARSIEGPFRLKLEARKLENRWWITGLEAVA